MVTFNTPIGRKSVRISFWFYEQVRAKLVYIKLVFCNCMYHAVVEYH